MLAGLAELPEAVRRPEEAVDGQVELARAVFDAVAHPDDEDRFAGACALAERLAGPAAEEERALRAGTSPTSRRRGRPAAGRRRGAGGAFGRLRPGAGGPGAGGAAGPGHRIGEVMTDFPVPVTERGAEVVRAIVAEMAGRFRVSEEEAARRVFAYFSDMDLTDESDMGDLDWIDHQKPDQWAGSIYLGLEFHEVGWDADLSGRTPVPLPERPE